MELLKQVLNYSNVNKAYNHVTSNKWSKGVDGVTTNELSAYMQENLERIKQEITKGEYQPQAVLGVEIPKNKWWYTIIRYPNSNRPFNPTINTSGIVSNL